MEISSRNVAHPSPSTCAPTPHPPPPTEAKKKEPLVVDLAESLLCHQGLFFFFFLLYKRVIWCFQNAKLFSTFREYHCYSEYFLSFDIS